MYTFGNRELTTSTAVWCTWMKHSLSLNARAERTPLIRVTHPRLSPLCSLLKSRGSPPFHHRLALASSPESYSLGSWGRWPPSDTCYRSLDFPFSSRVPGACKSLIPGSLFAQTLSPPPCFLPPRLLVGTGAPRRGKGGWLGHSGVLAQSWDWSPGLLTVIKNTDPHLHMVKIKTFLRLPSICARLPRPASSPLLRSSPCLLTVSCTSFQKELCRFPYGCVCVDPPILYYSNIQCLAFFFLNNIS